MYNQRDDDDQEVFEIDPHELEKSKRQQRIKGKKQDKNRDQWSDGKGKKPKKRKNNRHQERQALRDLARDYR